MRRGEAPVGAKQDIPRVRIAPQHVHMPGRGLLRDQVPHGRIDHPVRLSAARAVPPAIEPDEILLQARRAMGGFIEECETLAPVEAIDPPDGRDRVFPHGEAAIRRKIV